MTFAPILSGNLIFRFFEANTVNALSRRRLFIASLLDIANWLVIALLLRLDFLDKKALGVILVNDLGALDSALQVRNKLANFALACL